MQEATRVQPIDPERREELIDTVDTWRLLELSWPIMRVFVPHFVEELELGRYVRHLLRTGRWSVIRLVPHPTPEGPSRHLFDVYGVPTATQDVAAEGRPQTS
jgi:hypothetical protein